MKFIRVLLVLFCMVGLAHAQDQQVRGTIYTQNLVSSGACTAGGCIEISVANKGVVSVSVSGTYTGALSAQESTDGVTWTTLGPTPFAPYTALSTPTATISSGATGDWQVAIAGPIKFRITALGAVTGAANIILQSSTASISSSGGGGGGGASTIADGADVAEGATTDAAATAGGTGSVSAKLRLATTQLGQLHTDIVTPTGTQTAANSNSVVLATDQTPVVAQGSTTAGEKVALIGCATTTSAPTNTTAQTNAVNCDTSGAVRVNVTAGGTSGAVAQGSTTAGESGMLIQGATTTSPPAYTNGQTNPLTTDLNGYLRVAEPDSLVTSYTVAANGNVVTDLDMTGYSCMVVQVTSPNGTLSINTGNVSGGTYVGWNGFTVSGNTTSGVSQSIVAAGVYAFPRRGLYAQIVESGYSAGSPVVTVVRTKSQCPLSPLPGTDQVQGPVAHGSAATAFNPLLTGGYASAAAPTDVTADGQAVRAWMLRSGAAVMQPSYAGVLAATGSGAPGTGTPRVTAALSGTTTPISMSTATTTQIVALSGSTSIYVSAAALSSAGASNVKFVYGTGSNCGTGTTDLTGAFPMTTNTMLSLGGGLGPTLVVPSGQALCVTSSGAVQVSGFVTWVQF